MAVKSGRMGGNADILCLVMLFSADTLGFAVAI